MNTRKYSKHQEKLVAKNLRGRVQANSGATMFQKGDVLCSKFLIECKTATKEKASMSIKADWIDKLKEEAFAMNKEHWHWLLTLGVYLQPKTSISSMRTFLEDLPNF